MIRKKGSNVVVYIDVLLFVNTVINYAVLMTTEKLLKRDVRLYRLLLGSLIGACFSLLIFIDINNQWLLLLLRIVSSALITLITFGYIRKEEFFKTMLLTAAVSLVYCGFMIFIYQMFRPSNLLIINDVVYIELPPLLMIAVTAVVYLLILLIRKVYRERIKTTVVSLRFSVKGSEYTCIGKVDTGCHLTEPFSCSPVIIVDESIMKFNDDQLCRIIPYTTINSSSYLKGVKADKVVIDKKAMDTDIYIASAKIQNGSYDAVINSDIVR